MGNVFAMYAKLPLLRIKMQSLLKQNKRHSSGFTLMELLVVIAIIGIMAAISGPALTAITNAGGVNRTVNGVSLMLEQSRAYAMSHNTYVWVGFAPDPDTPTNLRAVAVSGNTGVLDDLTVQNPLTQKPNYTPVTRIQTYNNVIIDPPVFNTLTGMIDTSDAALYDDIAQHPAPQDSVFTLQLPNGKSILFQYIIIFSPQGDASISGVASKHVIRIVLQPVRGANKSNLDPNVAALQLGQITGQVEVFRP